MAWRARHGWVILRNRRLARVSKPGRVRRVRGAVARGRLGRAVMRGVVVVALVGRGSLGNRCVGVSSRIIGRRCITRCGCRGLLVGRPSRVGRILGRRPGMIRQGHGLRRSEMLRIIHRMGGWLDRRRLVVVLEIRGVAGSCRSGSRATRQEQLVLPPGRSRRARRRALIALRVRPGRAEERRIIALVEARPATKMRARHGVLDRWNVAVSALLVSERHGAGSADSPLCVGSGKRRRRSTEPPI